MSLLDNLPKYFEMANVPRQTIKSGEVSVDNIAFLRQLSKDSYRERIQVSRLPAFRDTAPRETNDAESAPNMWPDEVLNRRKGKFMFRTLARRNFNSD